MKLLNSVERSIERKQLSKEEEDERRKLLKLIRLYLDDFKPVMIEKIIGNKKDPAIWYNGICKYSTLDLQDLLQEIKILIGNRNQQKFINKTFFAICDSLEFVGCNYMDLDIKGFGMIMRQNDDIEDILKELKIKHIDWIEQKNQPEIRLGSAIIYGILELDNYNRRIKEQRAQTNEKLDNKINNELNDKYKDL